jgi:hypothetical protein
MKRIHFIIVIAFSAMFLSAFRANAQTRFYLGGDAGINLVGTFDEDNHVASLMLSPELGFQIGKKWMIGSKLTFNAMTSSKDKVSVTVGNTTISSDEALLVAGINPYVRYKCLNVRRCGFWLEGSAEFNKMLTSDDDIGATTVGLSVVPMLTYEPTKHIVLYSSLNLLSFGCTYTIVDTSDSTVPNEFYNVGFNVNASNIVKLGDISVGLLYKF